MKKLQMKPSKGQLIEMRGVEYVEEVSCREVGKLESR